MFRSNDQFRWRVWVSECVCVCVCGWVGVCVCVCVYLTGIQNKAAASLCNDKCLCGQPDVRRFMPSLCGQPDVRRFMRNHTMASLWRLMNARATCIVITLGPKTSIHFHRNVKTFIWNYTPDSTWVPKQVKGSDHLKWYCSGTCHTSGNNTKCRFLK